MDEILKAELISCGLMPVELDKKTQELYAELGIEPSQAEIHIYPTKTQETIKKIQSMKRDVKILQALDTVYENHYASIGIPASRIIQDHTFATSPDILAKLDEHMALSLTQMDSYYRQVVDRLRTNIHIVFAPRIEHIQKEQYRAQTSSIEINRYPCCAASLDYFIKHE
jgi:hypothetical protein